MKNKTFQLIFAILLVNGLLLAACEPAAMPTEAPPTPVSAPTDLPPTPVPTEEPETEVMVFKDDLGVNLEFTDYPQRIISISASTTEILFAVGAGKQVVGRDDFSVYPEAFLSLSVTTISSAALTS